MTESKTKALSRVSFTVTAELAARIDELRAGRDLTEFMRDVFEALDEAERQRDEAREDIDTMQRFNDASRIVHYRNLASHLGVKPETLLNADDRQLGDKGVDDDGEASLPLLVGHWTHDGIEWFEYSSPDDLTEEDRREGVVPYRKFAAARARIAELEAENARLRADQARLDDMRARWNELVSERDEARAELAQLRKLAEACREGYLVPGDHPARRTLEAWGASRGD